MTIMRQKLIAEITMMRPCTEMMKWDMMMKMMMDRLKSLMIAWRCLLIMWNQISMIKLIQNIYYHTLIAVLILLIIRWRRYRSNFA